MTAGHLRMRLAEYGYGLSDTDQILSRAGKPLNITARQKGDRVVCVAMSTGRMVWSGADVGQFVETYWYATKVDRV